jgi:hypothetical protein
MATDDYSALSGRSWSAPASSSAAVTPSDSTDLSNITRWVYVGASGSLVVIMGDGTTATFAEVPAGTLLPIRVSRVKATGTTATDIVASW